jgi:hypothetical protein
MKTVPILWASSVKNANLHFFAAISIKNLRKWRSRIQTVTQWQSYW